MLKYAIQLAAFTAFVSCSSEKNFGIMTTRYILNYYNDQLGTLETLFENNMHKYLTDLETRALSVSEALATCVHEGAVPVEERLLQEVKDALDEESHKIMETMATIADLNADGIDQLWTSVSEDGTFRAEMNEMIMELKRGVFKKLEEFKMEIAARCAPIAQASASRMH